MAFAGAGEYGGNERTYHLKFLMWYKDVAESDFGKKINPMFSISIQILGF